MIILRKYYSENFVPTNQEIDPTPNSTEYIPQENESVEENTSSNDMVICENGTLE